MKRKLKKCFILISPLLLLFSCNNFLEEEPRSQMSIEQFFSNPTHAYSAVNILYREGYPGFFAAGVYSGSRAMLGGYISGLYDNDYKGQEVHVQHSHDLTLNGHNLSGYFDGAWDDCYAAISKANLAINNIASTPNLSTTEKNQLIAQAKFFRAINYFYLVKTFGDVPLILKNNFTDEDLYVSRSPSYAVYDQIVEDLKFAIEKGELGTEPMPKNKFRIAKGSVQILLADVYLNRSGYPLQENNYEEAASLAKEIISSNTYSLIPNGENDNQSAYNVIRKSDIEDEYMYCIEYNSSISSNYWQPALCYPSKATSWGIFKYSITNNAYKPTPNLLWMFDNSKDLRIQEKQFFHTSLSFNKNNEVITKTFEPTPYLWHDEKALFESGKTNKDIVVYRYAEALLIAAEAIAKTEGVTNEAISYLTAVRSRAYWKTSEADIFAELQNLSANEFIEQVWAERLREFVLECKIWGDVQRTRKFPVSDKNNRGTISFVDVIGHTNIWGKTFEKKHLLFPISENERQRNPNLQQNPGY